MDLVNQIFLSMMGSMTCTLSLYSENENAPNGIASTCVDYDDAQEGPVEYLMISHDVEKWCVENLREEYEAEFFAHSFRAYADAGYTFEFHFGNEVDLILFKMRWGV